MTGYESQVAAALDALAIRSPDAYSWLGQKFRGTPGGREWLVRRVQLRLYADFYLTGGPAPASAAPAWRLDPGGRSLGATLSASNAGRGSRQTGWTWRRAEGDSVVVARDGLELWARPGEVVLGGDGSGAPAQVVVPSERRGLSEGYYTVLGDAGTGAGDGGIDRVYWHLRPAGAARLVAAASEVLNREGLPFRLKVANGRRSFRRCDAGVLYTRREDRIAALSLARVIHHRVAPEMREAVPALTLRLAPGLAFAEDPGDGQSYGSHRCALIADAVLAAWASGQTTTAARLARISERFRSEGLELGRPYLGPSAGDDPARWGVAA